MKIFIFAIAILAVLAIAFQNTPKDTLNNKPLPKTVEERQLMGWFASWDNEKAEETLPSVMHEFKIFSPMLYRVMDDGSLGRHEISNRDQIIAIARENNKPIEPVITDESDAKRIQTLLYDDAVQRNFVKDLIIEANQENYSGWSIDIEKITSKDRNAFSEFVINLSKSLHENGLHLNMIAYGKDADETYDPALAHDYRVFGEYADTVQLMIYYYSNEYTDPGGQTPLAAYKSVLSYALKTIPREKIVVGLSTHGNDWGGDEIEGLTYPEVQERVQEEAAEVRYDKEQLSMVATYKKDGTKHILYYENAQTIIEKMDIARNDFGINKFAFWRLSAEDPELWKKL